MLDRKKTAVAVARSARKEPFTDGEIRSLLKNVTTVVVAKGRKTERLAAREVKPADLKGPTGNYRAPMLLKGKTLIVGYSSEELDGLI